MVHIFTSLKEALTSVLPIAIIVKISYMLSGDFKSIFYQQKRVGKNGKIIGIYKIKVHIKLY